MYKNENIDLKEVKKRIKQEKDRSKLRELEIKLEALEKIKTKKEWKSNFVEFVNNYIMKAYKKSSILPSIGNKIFIDRNPNVPGHIIGKVDEKYFFTYQNDTKTVMVVFSKHNIDLYNEITHETKVAVDVYNVKTVDFGLIGKPVTSTARFYTISSEVYKGENLEVSQEYIKLKDISDLIEKRKNSYSKYINRNN